MDGVARRTIRHRLPASRPPKRAGKLLGIVATNAYEGEQMSAVETAITEDLGARRALARVPEEHGALAGLDAAFALFAVWIAPTPEIGAAREEHRYEISR